MPVCVFAAWFAIQLRQLIWTQFSWIYVYKYNSPEFSSVPMATTATLEEKSSRLEYDVGYREPKHMDPMKAKQAERLGMGVGRIGWGDSNRDLLQDVFL